MTPELELLSHQIVSALVNGVYQGALVVLVVWLAFRFFRKLSATTRHAIGFVALLVVAALPVFHFVQSRSMIEPSESAAASGETFDNVVAYDESDEIPLIEKRWAGERVAVLPSMDSESNVANDLEFAESSSFLAMETEESSVEKSASFGDVIDRLKPMALVGQLPSNVALIIVVAVGLLGLWRLGRLGIQFAWLCQLKRVDQQMDESIVRSFDQIIRESGCRRSVRLMSSGRIHTPIAVGYFDPVVLLPADLVESTEPSELDAVLRHEIAHINRRDDWFNLVQQFVAAACFFNPAIAWLSDRLTMDRELACDDHALSRSTSPEDYALTLTEFAGRSRESRWIAAPAAWNSKSQLKERISMILDPNRNTSLKLGKTSAGILAIVATGIAGIAFLTAPRLVLAQSSLGSAPDLPEPAGLELVSPESAAYPEASSFDPLLDVASGESSSSEVFSVSTTGSLKPARARSSRYVSGSELPESYSVSVGTNPSLDAESKTASPYRGRTRYGSSMNSNSGLSSGGAVSSFTTTANVGVVATPRVVVAQNPSALSSSPVVPHAPKTPREPRAMVEPVQPLQPLQPTVAHVEIHQRDQGQRNSLLEQRLADLERKLAEMSESKPRFGGGDSSAGFDSGEFVQVQTSDDLFGHGGDALIEEWPNPFGEEQQEAIEIAVEEANQHMVEAMKQVEIANQQIDRQVRKEVSREMEIEARRSALNAQKRSLEKQMRRLDQQMEALHHEVHSLEEQLHEIEVPEGVFDRLGNSKPKASF